jgi:hypothetical protein
LKVTQPNSTSHNLKVAFGIYPKLTLPESGFLEKKHNVTPPTSISYQLTYMYLKGNRESSF